MSRVFAEPLVSDRVVFLFVLTLEMEQDGVDEHGHFAACGLADTSFVLAKDGLVADVPLVILSTLVDTIPVDCDGAHGQCRVQNGMN